MRARATITLRTHEAGGREGPIRTGYRASVGIAGLQTIALVELAPADCASPGETLDVEITFGNPGYVMGHIHPGARITLMEGLRVVGEGVISELLGPST